MKKYYFILAAAAVLAAVSCEKEAPAPEEIIPVDGQEQTTTEQTLTNPVTLTFTANAAQTKVSLEGEGTAGSKTAVWDEGDQVKVIWYNEGESTMKSTNVTVDSYGTASTTFTATVEEADYYYAVYPATIETSLDGEGKFTVNFPNNRTVTSSFSDAAWYAAKTTKAAKDFAFHPITTIIKFTVNETGATGIHFRSLGGDFTKLFATYPVDFTDSASDGVYEAAVLGSPDSGDGENNVEIVLSSGAGTYYMMLPANGTSSSNTTYGNGFIFKIRKTDAHIPAAYFSNVITLTPGKLYNIKNAIDTKITWDYYLSPDGTGTGLSSESYSNPTLIQAALDDGGNVAFTRSRAASYMRDGITIHLKGGTYTSPITLINETVMSRTVNIVGKADGNTTTFTTTASSTFSYSNVNMNLSDIAFSGCTTNPAVIITAGKITFNNCTFTDNTATEGVAIYCANGSYKPTVFLNACSFINNTGTANGRTIYLNTSTASFPAALCANNCYFYDSSTLNTKSKNESLVCNKGKTIMLNSTLITTVGSNAWGVWALGCHKNHSDNNGCLILNSIVKNNAAKYATSIYETQGNYYATIKSSLARVVHNSSTGFESQIVQSNVSPDASISFSGYTWNGVAPDGFVKQSKTQILDELQSQESGSIVYELAPDFIAWLESIKYTVSGTEYTALDVDIDGHLRSSSAYWPGCYQND